MRILERNGELNGELRLARRGYIFGKDKSYTIIHIQWAITDRS